MTDNSKFEVPSGSRSEKSEGDLLNWEETMLEKIELLTAEFHKLRDMYHESQREVMLLQFELSLATQTDQMGDPAKAPPRRPGYSTGEEFNHVELKKFVEFLFTKQHADDKKRADDTGGKKK